MYLCLCKGVTESDVRAVVEAGARTADEVVAESGATARCGGCRGSLLRFLSAYGIVTGEQPWGRDDHRCGLAACPRLQGVEPAGGCPSGLSSQN